MTFVAAAALAGGLALVGRAFGWLTPRGTAAATLVGAAVLGGGGLSSLALLAFFFGSGSVLTYQAARTQDGKPEGSKGRTGRQVLANGLWAALAALLMVAYAEPGWTLLVGALAAAQADTWSTEIGAYARHPPRLITTRQSVPAGTSGAMTPLGTLAGVVGATAMAGLALVVGSSFRAAAGGLVGGIAGMLSDSLLGATAQGVYYCEACSIEGEQPIHSCGEVAHHTRGWRWLGNNGVNFVATGLGAMVSFGVWYLM